VQSLICTGNIGNRETNDWLKSLSSNFICVKGDMDEQVI
jgi:vacuolar protein sorting-associated protein 29